MKLSLAKGPESEPSLTRIEIKRVVVLGLVVFENVRDCSTV